jgi:hypothetical protein
MVFNEIAVSNTKFDAVGDIHPGGENMRINVRVLRLWKVPTFLNPSEIGSIEMVLLDDKVNLVLQYYLFLFYFVANLIVFWM